MTAAAVDVVVDGLVFPECPRWHDGALWFSDQHAGWVYRLQPGQPLHPVVAVAGQPSGLGWTPGGDLLVVSMLDRKLLRHTGEMLAVVADLAPVHPGPSNDMVVDAAGRAYIGNIGYDYYGGAAPAPTDLIRVDPSGQVHTVATEVMVPNGMALTPDGAELVLAESFAHRLTSFTVDEGGDLHDRRTFADLGRRIPDGICLDPAGQVWVAAPGSGQVLRVARGGDITAALSCDGWQAVACALGGPTLSTLYVCAATTLNPTKIAASRSGAILALDLGRLL